MSGARPFTRACTSSRRSLALTALALMVGVTLVSVSARAGDMPLLADYVITNWTTKDGLPSDVIWSVTQDREGYLWLGTNGGLVRFDGVRFVTSDQVADGVVPRMPVRTVCTSRDGSVWIGFSEQGGISRLRGSHVTNYGEGEGLPRTVVTALVEDRDGVMWAGSPRGLVRLDGGRWSAVAPASGLPESRVDSLYVDRRGHLLVGTTAGVYRKARGTRTFTQVDTLTDVGPTFRAFGEDAESRVWMTDPQVAFRRLGEPGPPSRGTERARGNRLLFDREGTMWVATMGEGLWRVRLDGNGRREELQKTRVSGARTIFEDRDGNIWAGAGDGLVRLRKPRVVPVTGLGLVEAVAATADGRIWATTSDELLRFSQASSDESAHRHVHEGPRIRAMRTDARGVLWVATDAGLMTITDDPARLSRRPGAMPLSRVNSIAPHPDGGLWISDRERGLFRWHPRHPDVLETIPALSAVRASLVFGDRKGRLWLATSTGRLAMLDAAGRARIIETQEGLGAGPYLSLYEDSRDVLWIGGFDGVTRFDGHRFLRLNRANRFRGGVSSIIEDADGDLWLATASGIVCIRRPDLDRWLRDPSYEVNTSLFDAADGLAGMPISFGGPSTARAGDGRLWFVSGRGLTVLDPASLKRPRAPAPVRIETVQVDEQAWPVATDRQLPSSLSRLQIDYTALDLTTPFKTRFRYRLEGFDAEWIDAGTRRQAHYTHLPPRDYRFHLVASTVDGSWADSSVTWRFSIPPRFYQTAWFAAASAIVLGTATWMLWQLRVRRLRRQFALLLGERVRLSRELHDTLLQGLVGMALQVDAVANTLEPTSPARLQIVRIRRQVEEYIREARRSIFNLRTPRVVVRDLAAAVREAAERATGGTPVDVEIVQLGSPQNESAAVNEELLRICQEAVLNAVRHGHASEVKVELRYDAGAIVLRIADNGRGFDPDAAPPDAAGHYGIVSMRERAEQIGGHFHLTTSANAGTIVEARVPPRS